MKSSMILVAFALLCGSAEGARAEATCESVRTDLTGPQVFGRHAMDELSRDARAGNCTAAAAMARRARDAVGFLATHCQSDAALQSLAADDLRLGERVLKTDACQN